MHSLQAQLTTAMGMQKKKKKGMGRISGRQNITLIRSFYLIGFRAASLIIYYLIGFRAVSLIIYLISLSFIMIQSNDILTLVGSLSS